MSASCIRSLIRTAVPVFVSLYLSLSAWSRSTNTPPASTETAQNAYAGCLVAANDSIFNTPITALPVHANSPLWIAQSLAIAKVGVTFGEAWDVNLVDNSVAPTPMTFRYTPNSNGVRYPLIKGNARTREGGAVTSDGNNDHHMITLNRQTCHWYETYQDYWTSLTPPIGFSAQSGWDYLGTSYAQPTNGTTDAAGLPLMPLTIHLSEMQAGAIRHAMRFTSCAGCISNDVLWPATYSTAYAPTAAPMGSRWRLKASYSADGIVSVTIPAYPNNGLYNSGTQPTVAVTGCNIAPVLTVNEGYNYVSSVTVNNPGSGCVNPVVVWSGGSGSVHIPPVGATANMHSPGALVILTALKQYGMILADIGGISQVQIAQDVNLDPSASAAFVEVGAAKITQDQFEIVDEASLMLSVNSSQARFAPPANQPVLVGVPSPVIYPQAGMSYQLQSWVNGSTNQSVNWTLLSGSGSVTNAGIYSAPAIITTPMAFALQGLAQADPTNPVIVSGSVLPSGTIRLNAGDKQPYLDTKGNAWLADNVGVLTGSYANNDATYPADLWATVGTPPDGMNLYGWSKYTWGDDIQYGPFVVPNGAYSVQFYFANACTAGSTYSETEISNNTLTTGGTVGLEANGAMTLFSIGKAVLDQCRTPTTPSIQVVVTNNLLRVALRSTSVGNTQQAPFLNALVIAQSAKQLQSNQIAIFASGLAYSRASQTFNGTLTVKNISSDPIKVPLQVVFNSLTAGITLLNATDMISGSPYITAPALTNLGPGNSVVLNVQFKDPSAAAIKFDPAVYSGSFN